MNCTVTTLSENTVPAPVTGLMGEHGQSFFIQAGEAILLFDTGQGLTLIQNAAHLGLDLKAVQTVVLSHGHNDHSGGLAPLAAVTPGFTLVAHPDAFSEKWVRSDTGLLNRGIPVDPEDLGRKGVRVVRESRSIELVPGVLTTGEIRMETDFEAIEAGFFTRKNGEIVPDGLADDQALILDTARGVVVLLGCTHRGLINTMNQAVRLTGKRRFHTVVGGLHLAKAPADVLNKIVEGLNQFEIANIGVGHCTGNSAAKRLVDAFGDRVFYNGVGKTFRF